MTMNNKKIRFWLILLSVLLITSLGCSLTNFVGDQIEELVEDLIPDADEIDDLIQDIPGEVEDLIPSEGEEVVPDIPAEVEDLVPEEVEDLIPEDVEDLIPEELDQGSAENVPIPENATNKEDISGIITFDSPDDPDQVADFYRQKLPEGGWNITNEESLGPFVMISAEKESDSVEIVINPGLSSGSMVIITSMIP
jgi:hypothetical protein